MVVEANGGNRRPVWGYIKVLHGLDRKPTCKVTVTLRLPCRMTTASCARRWAPDTLCCRCGRFQQCPSDT